MASEPFLSHAAEDGAAEQRANAADLVATSLVRVGARVGGHTPRMRVAVVGLILALGITGCVQQSPEQPFSGTATLSWTPPKTDIAGKTLTNLAGYKIHYGTSVKAMYTVVVLENSSQTTYIVKNLHPGTWYFAVSAYTTTGAEGALSDIGSKTIK